MAPYRLLICAVALMAPALVRAEPAVVPGGALTLDSSAMPV